MAHRNVSHLARINAEASIMLDTKAPIDIPPIFNTASSHNSANEYRYNSVIFFTLVVATLKLT